MTGIQRLDRWMRAGSFVPHDEPKSAKNRVQPAKTASAAKKKVSIVPAPYVSPTGGGFGTTIKW